MRWAAVGVALIAALAGCGGPPSVAGRFQQSVEADPWAAVSRAPTGPPSYLGNGILGVRLSASGFGSDSKGDVLPCFALWKNALIRLPNVSGLELQANGRELDAEASELYLSRLDFRKAILTIKWRQALPDGVAVGVEVETAADPELPVIAQRVTITANRSVRLEIWSGIRNGTLLPDSTAETFRVNATPAAVSRNELPSEPPRAEMTVVQRLSGRTDGEWVALGDGYEYTGAAGTEAFVLERVVSLPESYGPDMPAVRSTATSFEAVSHRSAATYAGLWDTDIEIDGPVEDQQAIRSFLFYLYMSGSAKLPPMALSNDKYNGHRFWDAEAWMLPVYAYIRPRIAREATVWRISVTNPDARIPWETGADGSDMTPPEFRNALHVGGWTAWWLNRAAALGLVRTSQARPIIESVASDFSSYATSGARGAELRGVISPDEGRKRNNDLTTNLLAKYVAGLSSSPALRRFGERVVLPQADDGLPATYDGDHLNRYQQAAALLALYLLEWPFPSQVSRKLFDRYKEKVSDAGPAMSDSVHAVIAARLGRPEEAYKFWLQSWRPFVRPEKMLFCERRATNDAYFATGAAGSLGSVLFGFFGMKIERDVGEGGAASKPLANGYRLAVRPQLPSAWKRAVFRNAHVMGRRYTIIAYPGRAILFDEGE